jgi:hypothetical protein
MSFGWNPIDSDDCSRKRTSNRSLYRLLRDISEPAVDAADFSPEHPDVSSLEEFTQAAMRDGIEYRCRSMLDGVDTNLIVQSNGSRKGYFCVVGELKSNRERNPRGLIRAHRDCRLTHMRVADMPPNMALHAAELGC